MSILTFMAPSWLKNKVEEVLQRDKSTYVCASGISVSGVLHPGKLRDVFLANQVYLELKRRNNSSKLIYFIDDFDHLKKSPKGNPQFQKCIGMPYYKISSPDGVNGGFVDFYLNSFLIQLQNLGINPEIVRESERYKQGEYEKQIKIVLDNSKKISGIIEEMRNLSSGTFNPGNLFRVYCASCLKDQSLTKRLSEERIEYDCSCGSRGDFSVFSPGNIKLAWLVNWPARWHKEQTDFEPIGPDHADPGSCFNLSKRIYEEIFHGKTPVVQRYGFINLRGGKKLSSSGTTLSLEGLLKTMDPVVVQRIFSERKPESFFEVDLGEGIFREYDQTDKSHPRGLPSFRKVVNTLNSNMLNVEKTKILLGDGPGVLDRIQYALSWITQYSKEESQFIPNIKSQSDFPENERKLREGLIKLVESCKDDRELNFRIIELIKENGFDSETIFPSLYRSLIGKNHGPKMAKILLSLDAKNLRKFLI